jgi:hypothetical protein
VELLDTEKAGNYSLADGSLMLTGQTISKATATGVNQTFDAVKNHAENYEFNMTNLLPTFTSH